MKIVIMSDDANWEPTLKAVVDHLPEKAPVLPDPETSDTESSDETMEMASPLAVDPLVYVLSTCKSTQHNCPKRNQTTTKLRT